MNPLSFGRSSDVEWALNLAGVICPHSDRLDYFVLPGDPKSKARPRLGKGGRFYDPSHPHEEVMRGAIGATITRAGGPYLGNVAIACVFFRSNQQRIDSDNMMKLVMDAATGVAWVDDCQVTCQMGIVELDPDAPRTLVVMGEHDSTMPRGENAHRFVCAHCGQVFRRTDRAPARPPRWCSTTCRGEASRQAKVRPGQGRGPKGQPPGKCVDCGRELVKRSFVRCRDCWKIARAEGRS